MASPTHTGSARNGARTTNLFCDADAPAAAPTPPANDAGRRGRGRGLVVTVDDRAAGAGGRAEARFIRHPTGLAGVGPALRRRAARADRNAKRLLKRIGAQRYGALVAFVAAAALLLAVSWLGLSLRAANSARDHLRDQRATATRALTAARAQTRVVGAQRDRARRAATAAHTGQVLAQGSRRTWKQRAERAQRPLTATRKAAKDAKHKG